MLSPNRITQLSVITMALLLSATLVQPVLAAALNQTQLSIAIVPVTVTEPSSATITATLTFTSGSPVKAETVYIQRAMDASSSPVACEFATGYSNVYNARTNNQGKITYVLPNTAGLGGKVIGYKAFHPTSGNSKNGNLQSESVCLNLTILPPPPNNPPVANAGQDQTVNENTSVTLDGSLSSDPDSGDTLTYAWSQTSGPSVTLSSTTAQKPTFIAPLVSVDTHLVLQLTVTDNHGASSSPDTVDILVKNVNVSPTANAGPDQVADEGTVVILDGSGSLDSDGTIVTYAWSQTAGPSVTLSSTTAQKPTFSAPTVTVDTNLTFSLLVTDNDGASSASDSVNVLVKDVPIPTNNAPVVNAGSDITVDEESAVNLSGTATDPDSGDTLTIQWTQVGSGPTVILTGSDTLTPSFTAPQVDSDTTVTLRLSATDNHGASATDDIVVTIHNVVPTPVGSIRNVNSQVYTDTVGNYLVTSSAEVNAEAGLDTAWIETYDSKTKEWEKRIENTPNSGFNEITCNQRPYTQSGGFADKNGCTAIPWGFEVWECKNWSGTSISCHEGNKGAVDATFDNSVRYEGTQSAKMVGLDDTATVVMAIPSYPTKQNEVGKPDIVAGETYRMEVMVKLQDVKGTGCMTTDDPPRDPGFCGFRIYQTFFDSDWQAPKVVHYGQKYMGTKDWFKVTFDATATSSTYLRGDPAIELAGIGTVWVDGLRFYSLNSASPMSLKVRDFTELSVTTAPSTATYFRPGYNNNQPVNVNNQLINTENTGATGTTVYMGPNSEITISKWTTYAGGSNIIGVKANIAVYRSYGGVATITATVGGVSYPVSCQFDTIGINMLTIIPCDLMAAGVDTADEINNLVLKVTMDSASNGSIDSIKIVVDRPAIAPANTWVPVRMTWFVARAVPDWRIGFNDTSGNVFYSQAYAGQL